MKPDERLCFRYMHKGPNLLYVDLLLTLRQSIVGCRAAKGSSWHCRRNGLRFASLAAQQSSLSLSYNPLPLYSQPAAMFPWRRSARASRPGTSATVSSHRDHQDSPPEILSTPSPFAELRGTPWVVIRTLLRSK